MLAAESLPISFKEDDEEAGSFIRIEDKYLLPMSVAPSVLNELQQIMKPDYPHAGTKFTAIESIYFDSSQLDFFQSHIAGAKERFKLRLRRYAPNGVFSLNETHLELKAKINGVGKKYRFLLTDDQVTEMLKGNELPFTEEFVAKNSSNSEKVLKKRLERINVLMRGFHLHAVERVTYVRRAFVHEGVRVTLDEQLRFFHLDRIEREIRSQIVNGDTWPVACEMRERLLGRPKIIMEIKHAGTIPSWLQAILTKAGLEEAGCSKYCVAVSEHIMEA